MTVAVPKLSDLLTAAAITPVLPLECDPWIVDAHLDSRTIADGDLFFALRGESCDGESFIPQALKRGARAIVAQSAKPSSHDDTVAWVQIDDPRYAVGPIARQIHGRPDETLELIGVTGTNGKTTLTYMIQSIAQAAGRPAGRIGTTGYAFGTISADQDRTTPEATELFRLLDEMRIGGAQLVAMEVSSHALSLGRVHGARFRTAAFLNLSRDHLDYYGDEATYFEAKASLFDSLDPEAYAILPSDNVWGSKLRKRTAAKIISFGRDESADVRITDERCRLDGSAAKFVMNGEAILIELPLPGRFNLDNAAAAAATALSLGFSTEAIQRGLAEMPAVPGRVQRLQYGQPFEVWVDYAHTPDALSNLLESVRALVPKRLLVVFGCGGDRDRGKRPEMGEMVARYADLCVVTSDNPRSEDPQQIIDDVVRGVNAVEGVQFNTDVDRRRAIELALETAEAGDLVIIAGKGHESTMTIGADVRSFNDYDVAARLLNARFGNATDAGGADA
jgi:UDP-N-acetylmuramoyl-L-alanyl-D-glutamate--2,6-diaminopimelate ligase